MCHQVTAYPAETTSHPDYQLTKAIEHSGSRAPGGTSVSPTLHESSTHVSPEEGDPAIISRLVPLPVGGIEQQPEPAGNGLVEVNGDTSDSAVQTTNYKPMLLTAGFAAVFATVVLLFN